MSLEDPGYEKVMEVLQGTRCPECLDPDCAGDCEFYDEFLRASADSDQQNPLGPPEGG